MSEPENDTKQPDSEPIAAEPVTAELVPTDTNAAPAGFGSKSAFDLLQRQAFMMSKSDLVPAPYKDSLSNCAIALEIAARVGCSPLMVAQNLDIIKGRPSWRAQYVTAAINTHPKFAGELEYVYGGTVNTESWRCYAHAKRASDGLMVKGPTVSLAMAKAEGWLNKDGSKWKTLPELMLAYRAATFFGRLYVPEVLMGMMTVEEAHDIGEKATRVRKAAIVERFTEKLESVGGEHGSD